MAHAPLADKPPFRALPLILTVLLILLGISLANQWYANNVSMPRYCDDPTQTLAHVRQLLAEKKPAEDNFESRRPYIIAAKLLFLLPQDTNENEREYLERLQRHLARECN